MPIMQKHNDLTDHTPCVCCGCRKQTAYAWCEDGWYCISCIDYVIDISEPKVAPAGGKE